MKPPLSPRVAMFANAFSKEPKETTLAALLDAVRAGRWREPVEAIRATYARVLAETGDAKAAKKAIAEPKKKLPAFCVSGTAASRTESLDHSDLLQIDLDGLGSTLETTREKMKADKHIAFGFVSPSGVGLKCGLLIDGSRHGDAFAQAQAYFRSRYGLEIDPAVKDPLRLCFVSSDQKAWTHPGAAPLPLPPRPSEAAPAKKRRAKQAPAGGEGGDGLDLGKLENVQHLENGSVRAACPACRAAGEDGTGDHLLIEPSGRFGCAKFPGDHEHRKEVWRLAGTREFVATPDVGDFDKLTAWIRGEIVCLLLNKDLAAATKRRLVAERVVEALGKLGRFYFHADLRDFDSAMFFDAHRKRLERIRSDAFVAWLSEWLNVNRADPLFRFITAEVEGAALSERWSQGIVPESYWAARLGAVFFSSGDGRVVRVTSGGVTVADNGSDGVLFAAGRTLAPWKLCEPKDPFECCSLFHAARCRDAHGPDLLRVWSYSLATLPSSKPPLCLTGDVGAGKTRTAKGFAELYGVPFLAHKVEERGENQFWPCLNQGGLFTLDNADTRTRWLADAISNAATDGCSQQRRLYTNLETVVLRARAWLVVTSANPSFANDAGLADRLLVVRMERRGGETGDGVLAEEILKHRDAGLSHVARTIQTALADTAPTPPGLNARHPDFAAFAVRIGRALNREAETITALKAAETDKSNFCLENDNVASALLAYLSTAGTFTGTAAELVPHLVEVDGDLRDKLSSKRLGKRLAALWPHLQKALAVAKRESDRNHFTEYRLKAAPSARTTAEEPPPPAMQSGTFRRREVQAEPVPLEVEL